MSNVDVEIYVSQLINFFENNPNDLIDLIGDVQKDEFYQKVREKCEENVNKGEDIVLTKDQIIDIVIELKMPELENKLKPKKVKVDMIIEIDKLFKKTKYGLIGLN
jgi:hypothetical protein